MKLFKLFTILTLSLLCASCGSRGSSSKGSAAEFWEGSVKPGTYHISWTETIMPELPRVKHTLEIVLFENHEYELREKEDNGYFSSIATMTGFVKKQTETYNGSEKVWFLFEGTNSDNVGKCFAVLPSGYFYPKAGELWQWMNDQQPVGSIY